MKQEDSSTEQQISELQAQVTALQAALKKEHTQHCAAQADVKRLKAFAQSLTENLSIEKIMLWARKSEKLTDADLKKLRKQLALTVSNPDKHKDLDIAEASRPEALDDEPAPPVLKQPRKKSRGRQPGVRTCGRDMSCFQLLERREVVHDLKEEHPDRKYAQSPVFVRKETKQQLEYVRGHFRTKATLTFIYKDTDGKLVSYRNPLDPDFVKGGKMTNGAAAAVIADKVIWGLPLYRQAKRINMISGGKIVGPQLLNSYFLSAAHLITPVWEDILNYITGQRAIHGDESRLLVVNNTEKGSCALGQMWALSYTGNNPPAAFFKFYAGRTSECAQDLYQNCKGLALQADGYGVYRGVVNDMNKGYAHTIRAEEGDQAAEEFLQDVDRLLEEGILLVGCCAHARRKLHTCYEAVYKSLPESPGAATCNTLLGLIGELYGIEKSLRPKYESGSIDETTFIQQRKDQAFPVLANITDYAGERISLHEQEPTLYKALKYLLNQIDLIGNYLVCSELTPDNNFQEQQFRDLAIARRNSMFASSIEGAQAWGKLFICNVG